MSNNAEKKIENADVEDYLFTGMWSRKNSDSPTMACCTGPVSSRKGPSKVSPVCASAKRSAASGWAEWRVATDAAWAAAHERKETRRFIASSWFPLICCNNS